MYYLRCQQKHLKIYIINSILQLRHIKNLSKAKWQKWDLNFRIGSSSCFSTWYVPSIMLGSGNTRNKRKGGEGKERGPLLFPDSRTAISTMPGAATGCSPLDQRYKEHYFQRQKSQHVVRVRFSVQLIAFMVQNPHFHRHLPRPWEGPQQCTQRILHFYKIWKRSCNNHQLRPRSLSTPMSRLSLKFSCQW